MRTRVAAGKLQYINRVCNGKKDIVKEMLEDMQEKRTKWWKISEKYIEDCGTTIKKVKECTKEKLKEITKKWDTEKWKSEIEGKSSLNIYKQWKKVIKEEVYDNTYASILLFKARITGTLNLNKQKRHTGGSTSCYFCTDVEEDLIHFILIGPGYKEERKTVIELQQPYEENREKVTGKFLLIEEHIEKKRRNALSDVAKKGRKEKKSRNQHN